MFIVGASKGLGLAMALSFAKGGASQIAIGARSKLATVANNIRDAAKAAGRPEPQVVSIELDVTSQTSVEAAAQEIAAEFGKLDVLIHNAGVIDEMKPITDTNPVEWWRTFEVNLKGPYLIARSFIPLLLKGDTKTLVVVSSVGAHVVMPGLSAYQPGKLAVTRFMQFADIEYKDQGLIAYSVHPGNILTDIVGHGEGMDEQLKSIFTETPELSADSLVYLTNERREWLSGRYLNLTWDLPELTTRKKDEIIREDKLKVRLVI